MKKIEYQVLAESKIDIIEIFDNLKAEGNLTEGDFEYWDISDPSYFIEAEYEIYIKCRDQYLFKFKIFHDYEFLNDLNEVHNNADNESELNMFEIRKKVDEEFLIINEAILESLKSNSDINSVFKYQDNTQHEQIRQMYDKIYELEMKLREILFIIYLDSFGGNCYDLLRGVGISANLGDKQACNNFKGRKNLLEKRLENEFFYLTFGDYAQLKDPKNYKIDDLHSIIWTTEESELKNKINLLKNNYYKKYNVILTDLQESLTSLSKIRNTIAHNRMPSDADIANLEDIYNSLSNKLNGFFNNITGSEHEDDDSE